MTVTHPHDELAAPPAVEEHPAEGQQEPTIAAPEEVKLPEAIVPVHEQEALAPEGGAAAQPEPPAAPETVPNRPKAPAAPELRRKTKTGTTQA
jgi:hypothetical protein